MQRPYSPGNCPLYSSLQSPSSFSQHPPAGNKHSSQPQKQGVPLSNNALSITRPSKSSNKSASKLVSIPQQLIILINMKLGEEKPSWILEQVIPFSMRVCGGKSIPLPTSILGPWSTLFGQFEAEVPLGWTNVQITLHNKDFPTKVAIL